MLFVSFLDTDVFSDDALFQACYRHMPAARQEKIHRFRFERGRRLSLGAGVLLDLALRDVGLTGKNAVFALSAHGKPSLPARPEIRFNLSHSGRCAVCALSDEQEVGVDVEEISQVKDALIRRVCTPAEREFLSALPPEERKLQFFRLWTGKESYMKLLGTGLSLAPERIEIAFGPPASVCRDGLPQPAALLQWRIEAYWITLCTERQARSDLNVLTPEELKNRYGSCSAGSGSPWGESAEREEEQRIR